MLLYTLRRLAEIIPTLFFLATFTFFLLRLAPGGPFDSDRAWPPEIQATILHQYELDLPMKTQYLHWMSSLLRGDLKESFQYIGRPVSKIISESFPVSAFLGSASLLLALIIGIPLGCIAAWKQNTWIDRLAMSTAVFGISLPSYLLASLLILLFSLQLKWFPPALWEGPSSVVLPAITLGWRPMSILARLTRSSMVEVLGSDFIRTAYGKGAWPRSIIFKHALRNSLIPVVTTLGPVAANLITGSFVVEIIFQIPGIGKHFVQAILNRDYPLVMGVTLVYGLTLILSNLCVDLSYAWIDPRIRLKENFS